ILAGNKTEEIVANDALELLVSYTECMNGAFYTWDKGLLVRSASYGLEAHMKKEYRPGEGVVGQVFKDKRVKTLDNVADEEFFVSISSGQITINRRLWLPMMVKVQCFSVIELGSTQPFEELNIAFEQDACDNITLASLAAKGTK